MIIIQNKLIFAVLKRSVIHLWSLPTGTHCKFLPLPPNLMSCRSCVNINDLFACCVMWRLEQQLFNSLLHNVFKLFLWILFLLICNLCINRLMFRLCIHNVLFSQYDLKAINDLCKRYATSKIDLIFYTLTTYFIMILIAKLHSLYCVTN